MKDSVQIIDKQTDEVLDSNLTPETDKNESYLLTNISKTNTKVFGTTIDTYYGEDKWVYSSDEIYSFDDINYVYKNYVKDYILSLKINGYSKQTVSKYYLIIKNITKFLIDNNIIDGVSIYPETIDLFNKYIDQKFSSEGTRTHYRRIFKELLGVIEEEKGRNYESLKEKLSKNNTALLKIQAEKGKIPNIPEDTFRRIISIALKEIKDDSIDDEYKIEACYVLLLSQTGMRIGELALLESGKLNIHVVTDGTKVGYIDMWALKEVKYVAKTASICFMTPEAILAYENLEKLTEKERASEGRVSFLK